MEDLINLKSIVIDDSDYQTKFTKKFLRRKEYIPIDIRKITAFIPGNILKIFVSVGQPVNKGENLMILEAMKMKNLIIAPVNGKIKTINTEEGKLVTKNQLLIEIE